MKTLIAMVLAASTLLVAATKERVIQTNSAGDDVTIIDPGTNKVVGVVKDIEVPHGAVISPDGSRIYVTQEPTRTLDVVDAKSLKVTKRIPLSGRPNNVAVTNDGKQVYVGIAEAPGAVDVIDTATMTNVKSIPVQGAVHNVYVTPDGKYAVSGSVVNSMITVIDTATNQVAWTKKMSAGIRPMVFLKNADGSTKAIIVQLSNFHGFAVVDFASREEVKRVPIPDVPGKDKELAGIQGSPSHGLALSADQKTLWVTSKWYEYVAAFSVPDFKLLKVIQVGSHPEWLTIPPDGKYLYVAVAGKDATVVVDTKTMKVVTTIPVGAVPKRNTSGMLQTD